MQITENGVQKPTSEDIYNIEPFNNNATILDDHLNDTDVHVNAGKIAEIIEPDELSQIDSTDSNSTMWGKIKKSITVIKDHIDKIASETTFGHIKIGTGLQMADGTASVNLSALIDKIYPIGSIYMSVNNVSPAEFLGGTWERFAAGRTLMGVDINNQKYNESEKTGGSETMTLEAKHMASHTHSFNWTGKPSGTASTNVSVAADGNHNHLAGTLVTGTYNLKGKLGNMITESKGGLLASGIFSCGPSAEHGRYGGGTQLSTLNDISYIDDWHGHSISGNTEWAGAHGHGASASTALYFDNIIMSGNTGVCGNGVAFGLFQPYTTSYMWKRVA